MDQKQRRFGALIIVKKYDYFIIFLLSFLYVHWEILWRGNGLGVTLFALLFLGVTAMRTESASEENRRAARPFLFVAMASALQAAVFDDTPVSWFNMVFLSVCAMYWMMSLTGNRILPAVTAYLPVDLFCQMICVPFGNFGRLFSSLRQATARRKEEGKGNSGREKLTAAFWVVVALIMTAPIFLAVLQLLGTADDGFFRLVSGFTERISQWIDDLVSVRILENILDLVLAVPVAAYLFGALWANLHREEAKGWGKKEGVDRTVNAMHFMPGIAIYTAMILFLGAYFLFLALQGSHLAQAMNVGVGRFTTYSRFAREGFFELCTVCILNLGIMAGAYLFCKRREGAAPRILRIFSAVLSVETMLLAVTAMAKMWLYIEAYGLTRLRIYTSWFMIWLFLTFLVLALSQTGRIPVARILTVLSVTMFLILGYANADAMVVKENLARYDRGQMTMEEVNVEGLADLSVNARLALLRYADSGEERMSEEIQRQAHYWEKGSDSWYHWNGAALWLQSRQNQMKQ